MMKFYDLISYITIDTKKSGNTALFAGGIKDQVTRAIEHAESFGGGAA